MSQRLPAAALVVAVLTLAVALWNAWTLAGIQGEVRALAQLRAAPERPADPPIAALEPVARAPAVGRIEREPADLEDPSVQDRILDRLEEKAQRRQQEIVERREGMREYVDRFAREEALDEATRRSVMAELERRVEGFEAIRADVRSGAMVLADARTEIEALRAESEAALEALLGREALARLEAGLQAERLGLATAP